MNKLKIILPFVISLTVIGFLYVKKTAINFSEIRKNHVDFIDNHPFQKTLSLTKKERKELSIPPNKYFEQEYLLELNPKTGKIEPEKLFALQEKLNLERLQKANPGQGFQNPWLERGPRNVPGRTRAVMYDPNDSENKRVFAGGVSGGLWVNENIENGSISWELIDVPENLAVSSIISDPNNSQIMYLGTGESYTGGAVNGNGIWKSEDGGDTWIHNFGGSSGVTTFVNDAEVVVNSGASGTFIAIGSGGFGPEITVPISGDLALADDGTAAPTEACNPIINGAQINGKIAVIDRGNCNFTDKVLNAQNEGAIGVIMVNNVVGSLIAMGGAQAAITIPSVMISKAEGQILKDALLSGTVNITINPVDNDLPAGLVLVPGKYHVNNMIAWDNVGNTEIFATIAEVNYGDAASNFLGGELGLFKTVDNGVNWTQVNLPLTPTGDPYQPNDLLIGADNKIWMSTTNSSSFNNGGGTIFSSTDGVTFTQQYVSPGGRRVEMAASSTDPDKIYLLIQTGTVQIKMTDDGFATTPTILPLPVDAGSSIPANDFTRGQAFYDLTIAVDPNDDDLVYVGGIDAFRSTDGGNTWKQISRWTSANGQPNNVPLLHADIHGLIFHPSDSNKGLIVSDGGVAYANSFSAANGNAGAITNRFRDYNTSQFYKAGIGQSTSQEQFLAGAQDNGTNFISNATATTSFSTEVIGGDGMYCFVDKDGEYIIGSVPGNTFIRLDLPFTGAGQILIQENSGTFVNQAELDDNLNILFSNATTGTNFRISKITNILTSAPVRTNLANALLNRPPTTMKVSPYTTSSTSLYVGTDTGSLLKVANADASSQTWTNIGSPQFVGSISSIDFGTSEQEIVVTFHNYGVISIWFTEDGGTTWQNKEGDFPDIPVKAVMVNPFLEDEVILGTDLGVWQTNNFRDSSPTWTQSDSGMNNVKVTSFDLRTTDKTVLASTYGRGLFTGKFTQFTLATDENTFNQNSISIYPTVSEGNFTITSTSVNKVDMQIFDITGKRVYNKQIDLSNNFNANISLNKGVYFVHFLKNNFKESHKIIIR
jgi:hypothetical protein